jgi:hypothetical protein
VVFFYIGMKLQGFTKKARVVPVTPCFAFLVATGVAV